MQLSDLLEINSLKDEVVAMVTAKDVEYIMIHMLGVKKEEFAGPAWLEMVRRSKRSVARNFGYHFLKDMIGNELAEYYKEVPISLLKR